MRTALSTGKIGFLERVLRDFFRRAGREHLPWRARAVGAYEIWVSEIMLQQTQVSRVIGYYEKFLVRFPTVGSLAKATWEEFLPYYRGLGYYARGRNMLATAKMIVETYDGKFPKDVNELGKLPGVGPYTAAAIASFAYGRNTIAWDTNLHRVVGRFFFGSRRADLPKEKLEDILSMKAKVFNAAMMDFGSAICTARPKCGACPLSSRCVYFSEDGQREKQETRHKKQDTKISKTSNKKSKINWRDARAFVFLHENHRKYYSSRKTKFVPFAIPPSHNTRAGVKDWFRDRHGLELAVRPPHRKEMVDGKPTIFINAQILSGTPEFAVFPKGVLP